MTMLKMDTTTTTMIASFDDVDQKTSLGFMELLGFQDHNNHYYYSSNYPSDSIFDNHPTTSFHHLPPPGMEMETPTSGDHHHRRHDDQVLKNYEGEDEMMNRVVSVDHEESSSVVVNGQPSPSSPNGSSSISNSTTAQQQLLLHKQCVIEKKAMSGDEQTKAKKKTKPKAPRFAFLTRTEIDHLDDGYRWRKYGQKAVKNSHFPRSYYRCTTASCNVKKRVERCMSDSSYVITTYEGQHSHPVTSISAPLIPSFNHLMTTSAAIATTTAARAATSPTMLKLDQGGLLQDMLPCYD